MIATPSVGACALSLPPGAQRAWILAGNALFTLVSNRTGARYTYKVRRDKLTTEPGGRYSVLLMTGPDKAQGAPKHYGNYAYLGALHCRLRKVPAGPFDIEEEVWQFHHGKRSEYSDTSLPVITFRWMWTRLSSNLGLEFPLDHSGGAKLLHCGRCGRCGRTLTVPESIESGYGPECASKGGSK